MTALKKYVRLECQGLWRESPAAQRRDVIVSFREATLILSDSRSEVPLTHWSLPAVERMNPGEMPALYSPGTGTAGETLEIDDRTMISALETVHDALEAQRPHPGRMRRRLLFAALAAVMAVGVFWLPGALVSHTARVVPWTKRQDIGRAVLADLEHLSGTPCHGVQARRPLARLTARIFGPNPKETVVVLRDTPVPAAHLPGGILVLSRHLIEDHDGPDVAAGYLLAEDMRADRQDPMLPLLRWVGIKGAFQLLTTGDLPTAGLQGYAQAVLTAPEATLLPEDLARRFAAADVPLLPYAAAIDPADGGDPTLVAADPFARTGQPKPLLSDGDWVALQGICGP